MLNSKAMSSELVFKYENSLKQFLSVMDRICVDIAKKISQCFSVNVDVYDKRKFLSEVIYNGKRSMEVNEFSTINISKRYKLEMKRLVKSFNDLINFILKLNYDYDLSVLVSIRNEFSQLIYLDECEEEIPELVLEDLKKGSTNSFSEPRIFGGCNE